MDTKIILIYCVCSDFIKGVNHLGHASRQIMETARITITSSRIFFQTMRRSA